MSEMDSPNNNQESNNGDSYIRVNSKSILLSVIACIAIIILLFFGFLIYKYKVSSSYQVNPSPNQQKEYPLNRGDKLKLQAIVTDIGNLTNSHDRHIVEHTADINRIESLIADFTASFDREIGSIKKRIFIIIRASIGAEWKYRSNNGTS